MDFHFERNCYGGQETIGAGCSRLWGCRANARSVGERLSGHWLDRLSDTNEALGVTLKEDIDADFFTTDFKELIARPEVDAVIIATSTWAHTEPTLAAVDQGHMMMIEKPLATDARESAEVLAAIESAGVDAVVGYTQRFRRRFLVVKERIQTGQIGDITAAVTRAFMNRMAPTGEVRLNPGTGVF